MKVKLDCEGVLIIEAENELEAFALDAWCALNVESIKAGQDKPDIEIVYDPEK